MKRSVQFSQDSRLRTTTKIRILKQKIYFLSPDLHQNFTQSAGVFGYNSPMSHKDNTAAQTLLFPVQQMTEEELGACWDLNILYWQARLAVTAWINDTLATKRKPSPELLRVLNDFNSHAREVGYPPLEVPGN